MPILYGEAGMAMMLIYRSFRENFSEDRAKQMMHNLLERSVMTDEEIKEEGKKRGQEEPEIRRATEATLKYARNGEKEEDKEELIRALGEVARKRKKL